MGSSGSGKTTIVNMIPRLLEPNRGEILLNGISLKNINANTLREICSYVEQKPIFIRGSILEHISYNVKNLVRKSSGSSKAGQCP